MSTKILFVDDEPDQAKLMQRLFRRRIRAGELTFLFAGDGEEALDVLRQEPDIDVVVSDINMPRMDGLTLLDRLSGEERTLKAVMLSAYGDMKNIRTAMNKGAFDFVTKPVEPDDLETTIQKTIDALEELRETNRRLQESERVRANLSRFYTAHGDAINTTARLESANKHLGTRIVVSGDSVERAPGFHGRPIGQVLLKGKREPVAVFEPLPAGSPADEAWQAAFGLMERGVPEALAAVRALAAERPGDGLVNMHLARLEAGATGVIVDPR